MNEHRRTGKSESDLIERDEFTLGAIALIITIGLLKANEIFEFFDHIDIFMTDGPKLVIRGVEFSAMLGFTGSYVLFIGIAMWVVYIVLRKEEGKFRHHSMKALALVILALAVGQFFAIAVGYAHLNHKFYESEKMEQTIEWSWR